MADTGAPWNIPYAEPTDNPRVYPALSEDIAVAVAAGLDTAAVVRQVKQVITTTNFTTTSQTAVNLTGVSVTIVPSDAAHRIVMWFTASSTCSNSDRENGFQFRRDTTDLFEETQTHISESGEFSTSAMIFDEVAGSTASRTYLIRVRNTSGAGTLTVANSSLIVMEYSV